MDGRKFPKDLLGAVSNKTGKDISEQSVKKIAGQVTPETLQSEAQIRQLIKQVSAMAGVPVSEETTQEIIKAVKKSGMNFASLESMIKMLVKK